MTDTEDWETRALAAERERDDMTAAFDVTARALTTLMKATRNLLTVIDAAGLYNLSTGVQLGPTVWFVKATEAVEWCREALGTEGSVAPPPLIISGKVR